MTASGPDNATRPSAHAITAIRLRHFFSVNCYLLSSGDAHVLVDTGLGPRREALEEHLRHAGCVPGSLRLIVLTHGHTDHAGNCAYLRRVYGAPIAMHAGDLGKVARGDMFRDAPGPKAANGVAKALLFAIGLGSFEAFEPDVVLKDGDSLGKYGVDATVLSLPGHTSGSVGVLTAADDLFCGDLLTNTRGPRRNSLAEDRPELDASVTALRDRGVRMVYPGHGEPFTAEALAATDA